MKWKSNLFEIINQATSLNKKIVKKNMQQLELLTLEVILDNLDSFSPNCFSLFINAFSRLANIFSCHAKYCLNSSALGWGLYTFVWNHSDINKENYITNEQIKWNFQQMKIRHSLLPLTRVTSYFSLKSSSTLYLLGP